MRAGRRRREIFCQDVIDLVLAILHAVHVIRQRLVLGFRPGMGRGEAQQAGELVHVRGVLDDTLLENLAEFVPELAVLIASGEFRQHVEHALGQRAAHRGQIGILLQKFARHVQGQVR